MHEITVSWAKLQVPDKWTDMYEREIWYQVSCPEGGIAIDIGAHYGFYTTKLAREAGSEGKVLAFEPNDTNRGIMESNLKRNDLDAGVSIYDCALSDYEGTGALFTYEQDGNDSGKHFLRGSLDQEAFYKEYNQGKSAPYPQYDTQIAVTTLDNVASEMSRIDLIKIDVEGAELRVLKGARSVLEKHSPRIVIEVHHDQIEVLTDLLSELNYSIAIYYSKVTGSTNPFAVFEKKKESI